MLAHFFAWLNAAANAIGRVLLAPLGFVPGWLSCTVVGAVTGVLLLFIFKHTSDQRAIKRVRDRMKADLLAVRLFRDSTAVTLRSQGRMMAGAVRLMVLAVVPILVMAVPVTLVLGQLALWYQARPVRVGESTVLTMALNGGASAPWPEVGLRPNDGVSVEVGPVRILSKREVVWRLAGAKPGDHRLVFEVDGREVEKRLAVGDGMMRVSSLRPGMDWEEILLNPAEAPLGSDSPVRSVAVAYPERAGWASGTDSWLLYWFAASMVAALGSRRALGVNI